MIEVKNLTKRYGDITAIDQVSFKVEKGEILGFLGPNGAGKSTTMRIITGALGATGGEAWIDGFSITDRPKQAKRRFGYLPEVPPLYPEMTVESYVHYAAQLHGVPRKKRNEAVGKALETCSLEDVAARPVGHLSKGYQQRVGLAQALVHEPAVLVLDEPTIGLDPNQIMGIRRLIKGLAGKHTVILSTHILPEVQMTCQRVVIINRGRIVAQDTIDNLSSQVQKTECLSLVVRRPSPGGIDVLRRLEGASKVEELELPDGQARYKVEVERGRDIREMLARLAVEQDWGLLELRRETLSLEDVFRELTTVDPGAAERSEVSQ